MVDRIGSRIDIVRMDKDLRSVQEARDLIRAAREAQSAYAGFTQEQVDTIVAAMAHSGAQDAKRLATLACEETGFGRIDSKTEKNLFATRTLHDRMRGLRTVGIIRKPEDGAIWEIATPMGIVAALIPSTNPTSTAMYKAIIAAKARCGIVMSPHPRAKSCTSAALNVVADAAYKAGAPHGLFGCMSEVTLAGTNELLEHGETDVILATGGTDMVRAAYSKGKPAYGVGSGNVPVYVDRSADLAKAARDIVYGASFDWGTLCSTERSVIADRPIASSLIAALKSEKAYFLNAEEKARLRALVLKHGRLNVDQVGQSPHKIASMAGFSVPPETRVLIAQVESVGREEPLSMETLSPILTFYEEDGWQSGCKRCIDILEFGGIGHTLCLHATNSRIIEEFAVTKPSMRIVVNTVAALGSVGYTNRLFPAMTLGPGTIGGSITSDNISPMHLLNIKRLAFETDPIHPPSRKEGLLTSSASDRDGPPARTGRALPAPARKAGPAGSSVPQKASTIRRTETAETRLRRKTASSDAIAEQGGRKSWIDEIEERLRARAGSAPPAHLHRRQSSSPSESPEEGRAFRVESPDAGRALQARSSTSAAGSLSLQDDQIDEIIRRFKK